MSILFLNAIVFFLPGAMFFRLIGGRNFCFFWSLGVSYLLLLLHFQVLRSFNADLKIFWALYLLEVALLFVVGRVISSIRLAESFNIRRFTKRQFSTVFRLLSLRNVGLIAILIGVFYYWGPYAEIPADIWNHLESIRLARNAMEAGNGVPTLNVWYLAQGWLWLSSAAGFEQYLKWTTVFNKLVFTAGCYFASREIVESAVRSANKNLIPVAAVVSTLSMLFLFGMGVFSYFRYYVFAPGYFAYVFYLFVLAVLARYEAQRPGLREFATVVATTLMIGMLVYELHKQEALFVVISTLGIVVFVFIRSRCLDAERFFINKERRHVSDSGTAGKIYLSLALFLLCGITLSVILGGVLDFERGPVIHRDLIDLGHVLPSLGGLKMMRVSSQFGQVFGVLGATLLCVALVPAAVRRVPLVLILPAVLAIFAAVNPMFIEAFLIFGSQEVVWRLAYMAPWPILLGFFFLSAGKWSGIMRYGIRLILVSPLLFCAFIVLGDVESDSHWIDEMFKSSTLQRTPPRSSHKFLSDLLDQLAGHPQIPANSHVITDPVTGYVLSSATTHSHQRQKFHPVDFIEYNLPGYSERTFEDFRGWLLVVNRRTGDRSGTGAVSGHWEPDVLDFKKYYSQSFLEFVEQYTETSSSDIPMRKFRKLWQHDDIAIYLIL